jgi:hypothetical protein
LKLNSLVDGFTLLYLCCMKHPKRPKDGNALAVMVAKIATGEITEPNINEGKNAAAVELGKLGGAKGGKARADKLTPKQRSDIAKKAAQKRWSK